MSPALALKLAFIGYCIPVLLLLFGAVVGRVMSQWYSWDGTLAAGLSPALGLIGFIGGLFAYRPLVNYLLDGRHIERDAQRKSLIKASLLIGPG